MDADCRCHGVSMVPSNFSLSHSFVSDLVRFARNSRSRFSCKEPLISHPLQALDPVAGLDGLSSYLSSLRSQLTQLQQNYS